MQDNGRSEERENKTATSGTEHRGDVEGSQLRTWYDCCYIDVNEILHVEKPRIYTDLVNMLKLRRMVLRIASY